MTKPIRLVIMVIAVVSAGLRGQEFALSYNQLNAKFSVVARPLAYFTDLGVKHPKNPWVFHFKGRAADESGDERLALESLKKAQSLDPNQAWHWKALGHHWLGRGEFAQAKLCFQAAIDLETRTAPRQILNEKISEAEKGEKKKRLHLEEDDSSQFRILVLGLLGVAALVASQVLVPRFFSREDANQ